MIFKQDLMVRILVLTLSLLLGSCAQPEDHFLPVTADEAQTEENADPSCSYFYFLWGNHAEYSQSYTEALEAYEKALICDPKAEYVAEKIPVLLIQLGRFEEASLWLENYIRNRPHKTVQRFMLARLKIQAGKEDDAIILYREALKIEPENNNIRLRLGLLYSKQKHYEAADKIFTEILRRDAKSYFATLYLARLNTKTGSLDKAENFYRQALELNWSKDLSLEIADFYNLQKRFSDALVFYSDVLEKNERDEQAALGMVQTLLFLGKAKEAIAVLTKTRKFSNNPNHIDLIRSQILINIGELEEAKELLSSILLVRPPLHQALYLMGVINYEENNHAEALQLLEKIPETAPEYFESVLLQVRIFEETQQSDQSIDLLEKALVHESSRLPLLYSLLSSIYQKQDKQKDALEILAQGVEHFNENEPLLYDYAILLEKNGNHKEALIVMDRLLLINPNHPDALNFIGYSWADTNINLEKALEYINKAIELKPQSGYIQDSLGWVLFRMGKFERARVELEKAIELEPDDPFIYDHLGDTHRALQNREKARSFYQKAIELLNDEMKIELIQEKIHELNGN